MLPDLLRKVGGDGADPRRNAAPEVNDPIILAEIGGIRKFQAAVSFLVSKFSSISTLLGSRRKICQRALLGTWLT